MQSHIRKVYACLAVTCHLHFWQNDRDLLRAFTCQTRPVWSWLVSYQNMTYSSQSISGICNHLKKKKNDSDESHDSLIVRNEMNPVSRQPAINMTSVHINPPHTNKSRRLLWGPRKTRIHSYKKRPAPCHLEQYRQERPLTECAPLSNTVTSQMGSGSETAASDVTGWTGAMAAVGANVPRAKRKGQFEWQQIAMPVQDCACSLRARSIACAVPWQIGDVRNRFRWAPSGQPTSQRQARQRSTVYVKPTRYNTSPFLS